MTASPEQLSFTIEESKDGTLADNLQFVLQLKSKPVSSVTTGN